MNEKLFELLVSRVKDYALFALDPEGRVMSWNAGAEAIKGYTAEEVIGRHFSIFYTEDALRRGWPDHELRVATQVGRFEDEGWRVRKDGSRFWANVVITALRDDEGRLVGFSKITRDLSTRRAAEEVLRESEERFRLLVEGVTDYAVFMLDTGGVISSWNTGAERIHGYARDEIVGRHFSEFYRPEDVRAGRPWEELAAARRDGRVEDEGWRVRRNGEEFWARVVVNALYDANGRHRGFAKVTQDLTQRQHARELEKTAARLNEFIAVLSHELRNPLAPIRTAIHVMDNVSATDPVQSEMRRTIDRQVSHLARLLDDMLDINKITRGVFTIERLPIDLAQVVGRAVEIAKPAIAQGGHELKVQSAPALWATGDAPRLTQVLANLLGNAARFTPPRGTIELRSAADEGYARISVRDTGSGIAQEDLARVFDMFVQAEQPINRVGGGLGVGLAVARRIVELHGGSIEARSEGRDKGAEFVVRLPLGVDAIDETIPSALPHPPVGAAGRRILVVDDNVDAATTLEMLLRSLGHETRMAHDGATALDIADTFSPDIVLLDIGMPGMNGYEVARRLRARQRRHMRIIAVTGWGKDEDKAQSRDAGFDLHLTKPLDVAALRRILEANGYIGSNGSVH